MEVKYVQQKQHLTDNNKIMKDLKKAEIYFENGKCTIITYNEFTIYK